MEGRPHWRNCVAGCRLAGCCGQRLIFARSIQRVGKIIANLAKLFFFPEKRQDVRAILRLPTIDLIIVRYELVPQAWLGPAYGYELRPLGDV